MTTFGGLVREISPHCLLTVSDQLVLYQSHHHSLFLDQTVSDALGGEGWAVRKQAAFESAHALLSSLSSGLGVRSPQEKLDLASELFSAMGHGRLEFDVTAEGGTVKGDGLHHGMSFAEKYGRAIRQKRPVDAFAAGFCSAAASLAFPSDWGLFEADETSCVARREETCSFALTRRPERVRFGAVVTRASVEGLPAVFPEGNSSSEASRVATELASVLDSIESDSRGHVRAFNVNLARVPASYPSQITFDTMHLVEKRTPELFNVFSSLVREAAQIGAFHLLGGVLASSMWRSAGLEPPATEPEARLEQLLGIARALGWGCFYATGYSPGKSLVLRSPATHESAYYAVRHGPTVRTRLSALQGTALAIMQLLHRVDFKSATPIPPESYDELFRSGTRFHVEESRSTVRSDDLCEVIVEALADR
jgi:hypothetical protein